MNGLTNGFWELNFDNLLGYYGLIEVCIYKKNMQSTMHKFRD